MLHFSAWLGLALSLFIWDKSFPIWGSFYWECFLGYLFGYYLGALLKKCFWRALLLNVFWGFQGIFLCCFSEWFLLAVVWGGFSGRYSGDVLWMILIYNFQSCFSLFSELFLISEILDRGTFVITQIRLAQIISAQAHLY